MEGETHLQRGRLVYGGGESSTEGETCLRRVRFVYGGETLLQYILRKFRFFASMKNKAQRTRDGGTEDGKQRSKGHEHWNRATKKKKVNRQGTEDGGQGGEP
jgi:hypothetical protein